MRNRNVQKEARRQKRRLGWDGCIKDCATQTNCRNEEPLDRVDYFGKPDLTPYRAVKNIIHENEQRGHFEERRIRREAVRTAKEKVLGKTTEPVAV